jgi:hypothetical protein
MTRRYLGIAVRVLAVAAAIYTFFTLRSQLGNEQPSGDGAIQVKVVPKAPCGKLMLEKSTSAKGERVDPSPAILQALEKSGEEVSVQSQAECDRLEKMNGTVISTDRGNYTIIFDAKAQGR